jgi:hypothetical protein
MDVVDTNIVDAEYRRTLTKDEQIDIGALWDCWDGVEMSAERIKNILSEFLRTGLITDKDRFAVEQELDYIRAFVRPDALTEYWPRLSRERYDRLLEEWISKPIPDLDI